VTRPEGMLSEHLSPWQRFKFGLREWRRTAKARLPFVRRRVFHRLERARDELAQAVLAGLPLATVAALHTVKDLAAPLRGEVCLFVSHAPAATLKPHVPVHLTQLMDAGIDVILVINTDLPPEAMEFPPELLARLAACVVRQNVGLDFAAWAHTRAVFADRLEPTRLLLVNDSIVGPLDARVFRALIERVRTAPADVIGMTENFDPRYHLQSFFLVFNAPALSALGAVFDRLVNLPTKDLVIDVYETRLTQHLGTLGLRCVALFPTPARSVHAPPNDTDLRWQVLVAAGFPFVKASVLDRLRDDPQMLRSVPEPLRRRQT
jgi:lipopolysaccharide biosynthesis protein